MQLGYYEFAGYGDLFVLGAIGLILVVRNWWDIIRYGLGHAMSAARPGEPVTAVPSRVSLRQVASAVRRLRRRGKSSTHGSHGHRHA